MGVIVRNCPHCPAEHSSFYLTWSALIPNMPNTFWNCAAVCGACAFPICFVAVGTERTDQPTGYTGNIEPTYYVEQIWPTRVEAKAPPHTPATVKARYLEGEDAFNRRRWNSAVAMYRSALDIATKGMEGRPGQLYIFPTSSVASR